MKPGTVPSLGPDLNSKPAPKSAPPAKSKERPVVRGQMPSDLPLNSLSASSAKPPVRTPPASVPKPPVSLPQTQRSLVSAFTSSSADDLAAGQAGDEVGHEVEADCSATREPGQSRGLDANRDAGDQQAESGHGENEASAGAEEEIATSKAPGTSGGFFIFAIALPTHFCKLSPPVGPFGRTLGGEGRPRANSWLLRRLGKRDEAQKRLVASLDLE